MVATQDGRRWRRHESANYQRDLLKILIPSLHLPYEFQLLLMRSFGCPPLPFSPLWVFPFSLPLLTSPHFLRNHRVTLYQNNTDIYIHIERATASRMMIPSWGP